MIRNGLITLICVWLLNACSSTVNVKFENTPKSNLNNRLDDVPVTIIIYQLKDTQKFDGVSDMDLLTREDGALGKDKIDSLRLQIAPDNNITALTVNDSEVPYLGILALFTNNEKKITKMLVKTKDASGFIFSTKTLKFEITQDGIKKK